MDRLSREILKDISLDEIAPKPRRSRNPAAPHTIDQWSTPVLMEQAAVLRKMAKLGNGSASETLKEYPRHAAMLSFRARSGEAEVHEKFADVFYVLAGQATLVTGGTVTGARVVSPGETRGDGLEAGTHQELRPGDVAHVPAGTPHQMLLAGDKTVTSLVVKIQEAD